MSDQEAIQGLWRLMVRVHGGKAIHDPATHYLFVGDRKKELVPSLTDNGKLRCTFRLNEKSNPKEIVITLDFNGPDGPPDPKPIIQRGFYRLSGDALQLCFGVGNSFPREFSDEHGMVTLERDRGPVPSGKRPSDKPALVDDILGRLAWEDLDWYSGTVKFGERTIEVNLEEDEEGSPSVALSRARSVVRQLEKYLELAKTYAVDRLLELKNDSWLDEDEEPVTDEEFRTRMVLKSIVFASGGDVTFYHDDGDLFWGHSIQIRIGADDACLDADIPG